jgi:phosphatidylserine/phosphatidylglycerophosphate/cardiolipin synthase-like enzyme
MTRVEVLGTGPEILSRGIRAIGPVIEEMILNAEAEIQMLAYVLTPQAFHILDLVSAAAEREVRVTMVVNSLQSQAVAVRTRLESLGEGKPQVRILNFRGRDGSQLHAKIIVVDRKKALVGSANLSWGGFYGNYEIALFVEGELAWELAQVVDALASVSQ